MKIEWYHWVWLIGTVMVIVLGVLALIKYIN